MATGTLPDAGQILNSLINSILLVDDELAVHYANPAAQQLLAQSARKLFGTPLPELLSYFSLNIGLMQESLQAGQGFTDNEVTLVIDGRSHILSLTAQRLPDGMILLEMAPMDNQRRLSQEQLQHAQQIAARDLVRGLAHEIKNPLGGLRGAAQLLTKALPDPALAEYTNVIIEQADRLRNLVDRLLGPQQPGMHVSESIHKVAERVVKLVSMELPDNVTLVRDYDPSLPELAHDPDQIEQVLLNIVRNALQALGPEGGEIILRTRTAFQLTLHGVRYRLAARIDVEDNGPGIPPHLQDTLFYPMVSGREGGTGLGLSIARNLIDQHSGKIEFTSWPGHTEFSVFLPIVWVVDDDSSIRWVLERALTGAGLSCTTFESGSEVLDALTTKTPDVLLSDIRMPGMDGLALLKQIKQRHPMLPVIIMTAHSDLDAAVSAYQQGAFDYLPKPFDIDEAVALVERAISHYQEQQQPRHAPDFGPTTDIIGEAPAMQDVFRIIGRLSRSSISVLINGESGTGKELVAHALHRHSPRAKAPFIALNMAAIPKDLIESELFGHEKGAFTGANTIRQGRFEQADGGTLFLDEIGDMPLDVQTRLLRVLADGQFYRVGGYAPVKVDVRIIAATHQNLELRVQEGKFREDLFHRLNVIRVHLPPLRERREDIPRLARHFLQVAARELGVEAKQLHPETDAALTRLAWPGNVRQLENTCRWLTVMAAGQEVLIQDLPAELFEATVPESTAGHALPDSWATLLAQWADRALRSGHQNLLSEAQPEMERTLLTTALRHTQGHKQEAARLLGWGRNTLTRKLKELGME